MFEQVLYSILGGHMVIFSYELFDKLPIYVCIIWLLGLLFLFMGCLIYGFQWFDLYPDKFGYHEVFHICIIIGCMSGCYLNYYIAYNFE